MALQLKREKDLSISIRMIHYNTSDKVRELDNHFLTLMENMPDTTFMDCYSDYGKFIMQTGEDVDLGEIDLPTARINLSKSHMNFIDKLNEVYKNVYLKEIKKLKNQIIEKGCEVKFEFMLDVFTNDLSPTVIMNKGSEKRNEKFEEIDINSITLAKLGQLIRVEDWKELIIADRVARRYEQILIQKLPRTEYGYDYKDLDLIHEMALDYAYSEEYRALKYEVISKLDDMLLDNLDKKQLIDRFEDVNDSPITNTFKRLGKTKLRNSISQLLLNYVPENMINDLRFEF